MSVYIDNGLFTSMKFIFSISVKTYKLPNIIWILVQTTGNHHRSVNIRIKKLKYCLYRISFIIVYGRADMFYKHSWSKFLAYLFLLSFHLESVNFLQFWDLEGAVGLRALHLQVVNLRVPLLDLLLHVVFLLEDGAGLVVQLHTEGREVIWTGGRSVISAQLCIYLPLFIEDTSGRGPTLSRIQSGTTIVLVMLGTTK